MDYLSAIRRIYRLPPNFGIALESPDREKKAPAMRTPSPMCSSGHATVLTEDCLRNTCSPVSENWDFSPALSCVI